MKTNQTRVLFICLSNAFRSRVAEAVLNHRYGEAFAAESAGFRVADRVSPLAERVMDEAGIPLENTGLKSVKELYGQGRNYDYVITICSASEDEECPLFPGRAIRSTGPTFPILRNSKEARKKSSKKHANSATPSTNESPNSSTP